MLFVFNDVSRLGCFLEKLLYKPFERPSYETTLGKRPYLAKIGDYFMEKTAVFLLSLHYVKLFPSLT